MFSEYYWSYFEFYYMKNHMEDYRNKRINLHAIYSRTLADLLVKLTSNIVTNNDQHGDPRVGGAILGRTYLGEQ